MSSFLILAITLVPDLAMAQTTTPTVSLSINENLKTFDQLIGLIQKAGGWLLIAAGALVVLFLIIGGIRYLVSAGNQEQVAAAKKTIINALIGLIVIVLSYFLVNLIINLLS